MMTKDRFNDLVSLVSKFALTQADLDIMSDLVDVLNRAMGDNFTSSDPQNPNGLSADEIFLLRTYQKNPNTEIGATSRINAIKEYRIRTGHILRDSKDAMDNWCTLNPA